MDKFVVSTNEIQGTLSDVIERGGYIPICVSGYSMRPLLRHNKDTVWIKKCTASELKKGRIVLYKRNDGRIFLHRIKKVENSDMLLMNGDAHTHCEYIYASQVLGAVYEIERDGIKMPFDCFKLKCYEKLWCYTGHFRPFFLKVLHLFGIC